MAKKLMDTKVTVPADFHVSSHYLTVPKSTVKIFPTSDLRGPDLVLGGTIVILSSTKLDHAAGLFFEGYDVVLVEYLDGNIIIYDAAGIKVVSVAIKALEAFCYQQNDYQDQEVLFNPHRRLMYSLDLNGVETIQEGKGFGWLCALVKPFKQKERNGTPLDDSITKAIFTKHPQ